MPQIIVTADRATNSQTAVMLNERVSVSDFESDHFQAQLVERIGWAVSDAYEVEQDDRPAAPKAQPRRPDRELDRELDRTPVPAT
jgi:hypothetical protein